MSDTKITEKSPPSATDISTPATPPAEPQAPAIPPAPATETAPGMAPPTPDKVLAEKMGTSTGTVGGPYGQPRARPTASNLYYAKDKAEKDLKTVFQSALAMNRLESTPGLALHGSAFFDPSTGRLMYVQVDKADVSSDVVQSFQRSARRVSLPTSPDMKVEYEGEGPVKTIKPIVVPFRFITV